jgi:hypothetical protein
MREIKAYIRSKHPTVFSVLKNAKMIYLGLLEARGRPEEWLERLRVTFQPSRVFVDIHSRNAWGGVESRSGNGSSLEQTQTIREQLPLVIRDLRVTSFLDVPCGDLHWMKHVDLDAVAYIGADIVETLIDHNQAVYATKNKQFIVLDIMTDSLPPADMIFSRDCLVHLSFRDIFRTIRNIQRSSATYLLTTTFTAIEENKDIVTGEWRPLNLVLPPFNFPEPLTLINENCTEVDGRYSDKSLGLWRISDIRRYR